MLPTFCFFPIAAVLFQGRREVLRAVTIGETMPALYVSLSQKHFFQTAARRFGPPVVITIDHVINYLLDPSARHIHHEQLVDSPNKPPFPNTFVEVFSPTTIAIPVPSINSDVPLSSNFALWILTTNIHDTDTSLHPEAKAI